MMKNVIMAALASAWIGNLPIWIIRTSAQRIALYFGMFWLAMGCICFVEDIWQEHQKRKQRRMRKRFRVYEKSATGTFYGRRAA